MNADTSFSFCFQAIPGRAQSSLLALCSTINPGGFGGPYGMPGVEPRDGKHPTCCTPERTLTFLFRLFVYCVRLGGWTGSSSSPIISAYIGIFLFSFSACESQFSFHTYIFEYLCLSSVLVFR